ncbi:hypothetical protein DL93DRAFT_2166152 [Clavulina sp. PMI_390]|nr:hypothetical protein DL93DRAFT_2166152 [Clavulina sp. PMI_390]
MFTSTVLSILVVGVSFLGEAQAGAFDGVRGFSNQIVARAHHQQRKVALKPHQKRGSPSKTCQLKQPTTTTGSGVSGPTASGVIKVTSSECPNTGATVQLTTSSGPNGSEDWLNCGITSSGGWNPPPIHISDLIYTDLNTALQSSSSPFQACKPYLSYFNSAASTYNIPSVILASIAMEESSCNPNAVGGAGEQGMMQITCDKCPNGQCGAACRDISYNVNKGAEYFVSVLNSAGGNVPMALGEYNGWYQGLTVAAAEAAANRGEPCQQNNLDYIHQQLNGWLQNVDPRARGMGTYNNMKSCSG